MSFMTRIFCILICILVSLTVLSAAKSQLNIVKEVQRVYGAIDAFQATFTQKLSHQESGSFEMRNGTLLFKKPLFVRWESAKPNAELLVINNREIWNYLPDENLAYRYSPELAKNSRTLIRVVTGQVRLDQDFFVEEYGKEDGLLRLRLHPLEPTEQMVEASIWVDPASYFIKKAIMIDFFGNSNEVTFTSLNIKLKLAENSFDFVPPKNTTVEDRRKDGGREQVFK